MLEADHGRLLGAKKGVGEQAPGAERCRMGGTGLAARRRCLGGRRHTTLSSSSPSSQNITRRKTYGRLCSHLLLPQPVRTQSRLVGRCTGAAARTSDRVPWTPWCTADGILEEPEQKLITAGAVLSHLSSFPLMPR